MVRWQFEADANMNVLGALVARKKEETQAKLLIKGSTAKGIGSS